MEPSLLSRNNAPAKLRRLFDSSACTCLLNHIDRYAPRIRAEGATDYLLSALFRGEELFALDDGRDHPVSELARAWNRLARSHRCTLAAHYVARVSGLRVPQVVIDRAEQAFMDRLLEVQREARRLRDASRRVA